MMRTNWSRAALAGLLLLLCGIVAGEVCPASAQTPTEAKPPSAPRVCKTPEEAFAAAQQARKIGDWKGCFSLFDEDSLHFWAAMFVEPYATTCMISPDELKKQPPAVRAAIGRLQKVANKHGFTEEDGRRFLKDHPAFPEDYPDAAWFRRIKDLPGFNAEMMAALRSLLGSEGRNEKFKDVWVGATLEGMKIEGERATATMQYSRGGSEKIGFRRVKGAWLLIYPVCEKPR